MARKETQAKAADYELRFLPAAEYVEDVHAFPERNIRTESYCLEELVQRILKDRKVFEAIEVHPKTDDDDCAAKYVVASDGYRRHAAVRHVVLELKKTRDAGTHPPTCLAQAANRWRPALEAIGGPATRNPLCVLWKRAGDTPS